VQKLGQEAWRWQCDVENAVEHRRNDDVLDIEEEEEHSVGEKGGQGSQ